MMNVTPTYIILGLGVLSLLWSVYETRRIGRDARRQEERERYDR